jgi:hypothetical protein
VFCSQFVAVVEHCNWAPHIKAMHEIAVLQVRASDVLHGVCKEVTYEDTVEALEHHFADQHLAECLNCATFSKDLLANFMS